MPKLPTRKPDVRALAQAVLGGIQSNPVVFPAPVFDWAPLAAAIAQDKALQAQRNNLEGQLQAVIEAENQNLDAINEMIRKALALCEATYRGDDTKIALLGWSRARRGGASRIGQPRNLQAISQGAGVVVLDWNSPQIGRASLRFYKIERQLMELETGKITEDWGAWQAASVKSEIELRDQPRGVQISYRVSAVNASMTSIPSNQVDLVL